MPSAPAGQVGSTATQLAPQFAGARTCGPVKSASLASVSAEALRMNAVALVAGVVAGNASPAPSFQAAAAPVRPVWPAASITAPAALRSWTPPVSVTPVEYTRSPGTVVSLYPPAAPLTIR